jgi:adhesin/invasin
MSQQQVTVNLTAILTDNSGNPIQNAPINFYYKLTSASSYTSAGSALTDTTGTASVQLMVQAPDSYNFEATFTGTSTFSPSQAVVTYDTTATQQSSSLTVSVSPTSVPGVYDVSGTLESQGAPVPNATINFTVNGQAVGSLTTNNTGQYSGTITIGTITAPTTLTASYAGSATIAPATATATIQPPTPKANVLPAAAIGIAVVGSLIGVISYIRRRRRH